MPIKGGRGVNGKITYIQLDDFDDTTDLMEIKQTDRDILLILSEQLDWSNRWIEPPPPLDNPDDRDAYIAGLKLRLMQMIDFCARMIDCFENDSDVQQAVTNIYNQYNGGNPMPGTISGKNLLPEIIDCDKDILFGAIYVLVDMMHTNNLDAFETFEEVTDVAERAALLISAIPIIETFPLDEAIDYIQGLWTDDLFDAYVANDTTAYRDTIKCDLLCLAIANNCSLSIDDMFHYFLGRIGGEGLNTVIDIITYLTAGTWSGTQINDTFFAAQILFLKYGNQFFSMQGIYSFELMLKIGSREPDETWSLLCEVCGADHCMIWDMTLGLQGWSIHSGFGSYHSGQGISSDNQITIWLYREDFAGVKIKTVRAVFTVDTNGIQLGTPYDTLATFVQTNEFGFEVEQDVSGNSGFNSVTNMAVRPAVDGIQLVQGFLTEIEICYFGEEIEF